MKEFLAIWLGSFLGKAKEEEGQGLVEYALIIVLVALAVILALTGLGTQVATVFNNIVAELT